jgi:hypothetical protein
MRTLRASRIGAVGTYPARRGLQTTPRSFGAYRYCRVALAPLHLRVLKRIKTAEEHELFGRVRKVDN